MMTHLNSTPAVDVWHALEELLPDGQSDPVAAARAGLPFAVFERVRDTLDVPDELLARILSVSERTLARRKREGRLRPQESDRLLVLADVVLLATQALNDFEEARAWLLTPHALLGGDAPLERLDTALGTEEVRTMLYHIEYSMPV